MRVFITGGTGTIGAPVIAELLASGHSVLALARSDATATALEDAGATALRGGLADLAVLRSGAAQSDGVISLDEPVDVASPRLRSDAGFIALRSRLLRELGVDETAEGAHDQQHRSDPQHRSDN